MNCELANGQFSLLLYGELTFEDEELVQRHLDRCQACLTEFGRVKKARASFDRGALSRTVDRRPGTA